MPSELQVRGPLGQFEAATMWQTFKVRESVAKTDDERCMLTLYRKFRSDIYKTNMDKQGQHGWLLTLKASSDVLDERLNTKMRGPRSATMTCKSAILGTSSHSVIAHNRESLSQGQPIKWAHLALHFHFACVYFWWDLGEGMARGTEHHMKYAHSLYSTRIKSPFRGHRDLPWSIWQS